MAETLCSRRCPLCGWTGDESPCARCGHGTVRFEVTVVDDADIDPRHD